MATQKTTVAKWTIIALMVLGILLLITTMSGCKKEPDCFAEYVKVQQEIETSAVPIFEQYEDGVIDANGLSSRLQQLDASGQKKMEIADCSCCWIRQYEAYY